MNILSVGNFGYGWDGSICDEEHIAGALEQLGHTVTRIQREEARDFDKKVFDWEKHYDFALVAQWDHYWRGLFDVLDDYKTPVVYWAFDYQADNQVWHEDLISVVNLYLSKRIADSKYSNWQWLSQDFAPQFLSKYPEPVQKDIEVLFTGTYLPWATERNQILKLVDENYNLVIYSVNPAEWLSAGFKHVNGPAMDEQLPRLVARAKINLSIDHTLERGYWSDRNAQIIACGGFVLFRYVPLSEAVFRSNITYFFNKKDILDSVSYWLGHDEDREYIAAEAYDNSPYYKVKERVADMLNIVRNIL